MNIEHLKNDQIDKKKWDERINNSSFPTIYALSWYLDIVAPNWEALVADDYEYVFPLTVKRKLKSVKYIGVPNFCQQLGLFSKNNIHEKVLVSFLDAIPKTYIRKDLQLNHSNPMLKNSKQKDNYILVPAAISEIRKNYSSQTKRNLKKAQNNQLNIVADIDFKQVITLFQETKGKSIEKVDYVVLEQLCIACSSKSMMHSFGVYIQKELVSGALFFEFNQRWYMILLASSPKGKELLASTLLIDSVIERITLKEKMLDFEGSSIPSLARFYKGFGGINEVYQLYTKRII